MTVNHVSIVPLVNMVIALIVALVVAAKFVKMIPEVRELDRKYSRLLMAKSLIPFSQSWKSGVQSSDVKTISRVRRIVFSTLLILWGLSAASRVWLYIHGYW